jgi:hypothetical protein
MGKQRQSGDSSQRKQSDQVEEVKGIDADHYESDLVKLKVEHQKSMNKAISNMENKAAQSLDGKQVVTAVKALQKWFKANKEKGAKKNLLQEEDSFVNISFTLTQVPTKPTPRPMQILLPKTFNSEENNTRVCIIVKDPESDFRE